MVMLDTACLGLVITGLASGSAVLIQNSLATYMPRGREL